MSSWGHDFRKEYGTVLLTNNSLESVTSKVRRHSLMHCTMLPGMLNILKEDYPLVPIVALTATARAKVAADTIRILRIPNCSTFSLGKHYNAQCDSILHSLPPSLPHSLTQFLLPSLPLPLILPLTLPPFPSSHPTQLSMPFFVYPRNSFLSILEIPLLAFSNS